MPKANQTPEQAAREVVDDKLSQSGRFVQDNKKINFSARPGTAVCEYRPEAGAADNVISFNNRAASPNTWTRAAGHYDHFTNIHYTLKRNSMCFDDLSDFIECYNPPNQHHRTATSDENETPDGRWRSYSYSYHKLRARNKTSLDSSWLIDKSRTDLDNLLLEPDDPAEEIIENLEVGLISFREVLGGFRQS